MLSHCCLKDISADKFRVKFLSHVKKSEGTWKDFSFELQNYFEEWLLGLEILDFHSLKNLIVTEQLKKQVNSTTRDHFVDDWPKITNPDQLADKLDNYDNVRSNNSNKYRNFTSYNSHCDKFQMERKLTPFNENKSRDRERAISSSIRNEKGQFKCFNCNDYGHIARDCPEPKAILFCKKCNKQGHNQRA